MFKALTWIWLSKVNEPALPKKRWIKVDKVPPEKNGSERELLTIEAHPPFTRYAFIFVVFFTIESQDTNRYTTLFWLVTGEVEFRIVGGLTMKDRWFFQGFQTGPYRLGGHKFVVIQNIQMTFRWVWIIWDVFNLGRNNLLNCTVTYEGIMDLSLFCWRVADLILMKCSSYGLFCKGSCSSFAMVTLCHGKIPLNELQKNLYTQVVPFVLWNWAIFLRFDTAWLIIVWFEMGISDFDGLSLFSPWPLP